jgi:3'-phosphoadenosine 5'-phosphosulfate sulfotransferase (PAPS reductase)/FAD synthetase
MKDLTNNQIKLMQLRNYQAMPLGAKINRALYLIREWYEAHNGQVYIAFSGGKDSTVLLDLVQSIYPDVPAVFADTGNELKSVIDHVKTYGDAVTWVKPKMTFEDVIKKHGYPVVSKDVSKKVYEARTTKSEHLLNIRLNGYPHNGKGKIPERWKFLLNAPFMPTSRCCGILKGAPSTVYGRKTKRKAYVGIMAEESNLRNQSFIRYGCNAFGKNDPDSRPLIFWTEQDILEYLVLKSLAIPSVYGDIVKVGGVFKCSGQDRTGCKLCLFGCYAETGTENRIQRLAWLDPESYILAIEKLGYSEVMDFMGWEWRPLGMLGETKENVIQAVRLSAQLDNSPLDGQ